MNLTHLEDQLARQHFDSFQKGHATSTSFQANFKRKYLNSFISLNNQPFKIKEITVNTEYCEKLADITLKGFIGSTNITPCVVNAADPNICYGSFKSYFFSDNQGKVYYMQRNGNVQWKWGISPKAYSLINCINGINFSQINLDENSQIFFLLNNYFQKKRSPHKSTKCYPLSDSFYVVKHIKSKKDGYIKYKLFSETIGEIVNTKIHIKDKYIFLKQKLEKEFNKCI